MRLSRVGGGALVAFAAMVFAPGAVPAQVQVPGDVNIVNISSTGRRANAPSGGVASNADGSVVAFFSDATNLVPADTNRVRDVFVHDSNTGLTERVSVGSDGVQANGPSQQVGFSPSLSADGNLVAFYSKASNLVEDDFNRVSDVFLRDRAAGVTEIISVSSSGEPGNGQSWYPSISADGRFVAFQSLANNLVDDDTNGASDIFVRDRATGTTERPCGVQGNRSSLSPAISADGNFVAFASAATNLVPDDTNNRIDIFVCDRSTGIVERVSVSSNGVPGDGDSILPAINADGSVVAFKSLATNLVSDDRNNVVDVYARDRAAGTTERISVAFRGGDANDFSFPPSVSYDGRFVAFGSFATNLAPGDSNNTSNVFVRDRFLGRTLFVDVNDRGEIANGGTPDAPPAVSGDGNRIGFVSAATNLAPTGGNDVPNVFVAVNPSFLVPTPTPTRTVTPTPPDTPTPTVTPTHTFRPCLTDDDCPEGQKCRGGFCREPRDCESFEMCFAREACLNETCECGGDCNLDGYVLGNEITRGVLILGGVAELSTCLAADINGDGMVTGNEVTEAATNLREGCVQEGLPLVFSERSEMVTLEVGSAAAPAGGPVNVGINLSGGSGEVATVQIDLLFDPNVLDLADPSTACVLHSRLGRHTLFATVPASAETPPGLRRLRLFVADVRTPVSTFADGPVATCTFKVKMGAVGAEALVVPDGLNVADERGSVFECQGVSGSLSVLTPLPPPAPVCPGDCDGDREVLSSEVTRTMLIMSGRLPLSACPAADSDGDGAVFIGDLTRALLSLARGCPR